MDTDDFSKQMEWHRFSVSRTDGFWRAAFDSANAAGRNAINSILLGSGGAVVALLAFVGNLLSKDTSRDYMAQTRVASLVHSVARALVPFVGSMFLAMVTASITYLAMFAFSRASASDDDSERRRHNTTGTRLNGLALSLGVASLLMFAYGAFVGIDMLRSL